MKKPSLSEQEKIDEERLLKHLEQINQTFKQPYNNYMIDAISSIYNNGEKQHSPSTKLSHLGKELSNIYKSNMSTAYDSAFENQATLEGDENIIIQNLNISDEVLKLIVIGDKAVGKSLLIDKLCNINNQTYSTTQRYELFLIQLGNQKDNI